MRFFYDTIIACCFTLLTACNVQKDKAIQSISLQTLKQDVIGKDVQFIDVRTPEEYIEHIDDAVNISIAHMEQFKHNVLKLDKNKPVYVYCHKGVRSRRASHLLSTLGFKEIYDFTGGWKAWQAHNKKQQ